MYCIGCGAALPIEVLTCPNCGKRRCILDDPANDPSPSDATPATEKIADGCTRPLGSDNPTSGNSAAPAADQPKSSLRHYNGGSITLGAFGLICFIISAVQGFIPIFLIAGLVFGGLAWLCAVKWPLSEVLLSVVLVSSLLVAGVVGIALDRDTFRPSYRYLTQGNSEIRIDEKNGRTDQLTNGGWQPIAFDHDAMQLPQDQNSRIALSNGEWKSFYSSGEVCFDVLNSSDYVVKTIAIAVKVKDKAGNEVEDLSDSRYSTMYIPNKPDGTPGEPAGTTLTSSYGLLNTGGSDRVCKGKPRALADGETWSYTGTQAWGWKK